MGYRIFRIFLLAIGLHALPTSGDGGFSFVSPVLADDDHESDDSGSDDDHDDHDDHDDRSSSSSHGNSNAQDDDSDSDDTLRRVRDGVRNDTLMPLWMIKTRVIAQFGRKIIGIDIEQKKQLWIYEFKVVDRKGRLLEISVNAKDGSIIEVKNDK